ncbi:hypothetical protein L6452_22163 [Arctium lappa]|uniref:Uncharacterized protein n=1 Tax=Arctium lappa TaxID=4217 RepID=A0ACB9AZ27_ARCLA|nr:hypothetical protein L6452_22163 [Arctium lappa]
MELEKELKEKAKNKANSSQFYTYKPIKFIPEQKGKWKEINHSGPICAVSKKEKKMLWAKKKQVEKKVISQAKKKETVRNTCNIPSANSKKIQKKHVPTVLNEIKNSTSTSSCSINCNYIQLMIKLKNHFRDYGCSRHMTGDKKFLTSFKAKSGGAVTFVDNMQGQIKGYGELTRARTPQQKGVVERKNRTLIEATRTMLAVSDLPTKVLAEAVATTCFTQNRATIVIRFKKTSYELINYRKPNVKYFQVFRWRCYTLNDRESLGIFEKKADEEKFIGYSLASKAFRVFNLRTRTIQESINVSFDDTKSLDNRDVNPTTKNIFESPKLREYELNKIFEDFLDDDDDSEFIFKDVHIDVLEEPQITGTTLSGPSDVTPFAFLNIEPRRNQDKFKNKSSEVEDEQETSEETPETFVEETQEPASPSLECWELKKSSSMVNAASSDLLLLEDFKVNTAEYYYC